MIGEELYLDVPIADLAYDEGGFRVGARGSGPLRRNARLRVGRGLPRERRDRNARLIQQLHSRRILLLKQISIIKNMEVPLRTNIRFPRSMKLCCVRSKLEKRRS